MVGESSQKFIARNRAPRVQIEYDVEIYGSEKKVQLPFVMGVLADLYGKPAEPPPADRRPQVPRDRRRQFRRPAQGDEAARASFRVQNTLDRRGRAAGRHHLREHGRLPARRDRAQGRAAAQAARGAPAARQPADLHGRQGQGRGAGGAAAAGPGADAGAGRAPKPAPRARATTTRPAETARESKIMAETETAAAPAPAARPDDDRASRAASSRRCARSCGPRTRRPRRASRPPSTRWRSRRCSRRTWSRPTWSRRSRRSSPSSTRS